MSTLSWYFFLMKTFDSIFVGWIVRVVGTPLAPNSAGTIEVLSCPLLAGFLVGHTKTCYSITKKESLTLIYS